MSVFETDTPVRARAVLRAKREGAGGLNQQVVDAIPRCAFNDKLKVGVLTRRQLRKLSYFLDTEGRTIGKYDTVAMRECIEEEACIPGETDVTEYTAREFTARELAYIAIEMEERDDD